MVFVSYGEDGPAGEEEEDDDTDTDEEELDEEELEERRRWAPDKWCRNTPLIQSALQHSVLGSWS